MAAIVVSGQTQIATVAGSPAALDAASLAGVPFYLDGLSATTALYVNTTFAAGTFTWQKVSLSEA